MMARCGLCPLDSRRVKSLQVDLAGIGTPSRHHSDKAPFYVSIGFRWLTLWRHGNLQ